MERCKEATELGNKLAGQLERLAEFSPVGPNDTLDTAGICPGCKEGCRIVVTRDLHETVVYLPDETRRYPLEHN